MSTQPTTNNLEGWRMKLKKLLKNNRQAVCINVDCEVCDEKESIIIDFVSYLRKHDMEELIKIIDNSMTSPLSFKELIKDYYNK